MESAWIAEAGRAPGRRAARRRRHGRSQACQPADARGRSRAACGRCGGPPPPSSTGSRPALDGSPSRVLVSPPADVHPAAPERRASLRYLLKQKVKRNEKFPLLVELEPLFQCNLACSFCGKIQYPQHILKKRMPVDTGARGDRGVRRADGVDRRRRAARAPRGARDRRGADQAQEVRLPVHERDPDEEEDGQLRAVAVLRVGRPPRRDARAPRPVRRARGHVRQGRRRRSRRRRRRGFRVNTNTTFLTTDTPKTVRDVLDFLNDELKVDQMMLSPAYAYEKAPDQEHFPGVTADAEAVLARRSPTATASAGGSTTRRSSSTSSRARSTSSARRGGSRATRSSAGSGPAT